MRKKYTAVLFVFLCLCAVVASAEGYYWEHPQYLTGAGAVFPVVASSKSVSAVIWQEAVPAPRDAAGTIHLSARVLNVASNEWTENRKFAGPFPFAGEIPRICSVAVNDSGTIAVAAAIGIRKVSIFLSRDYGKTFREIPLPSSDSVLLMPRIFVTAKGGFLIFASQGNEESFSLLYSHSATGERWSPFTVFPPGANLANPFLPTLFSHRGHDIVLFQSSYGFGRRFSYQLFSSVSVDNGATWSDPVHVTTQETMPQADSTAPFSSYHNQRPSGLSFNGSIYITWERTNYLSENAAAWVAQLDEKGHIVPNTAEAVSPPTGVSNVQLFANGDTLSLLWSDMRRGNEAVYLTQKNSFFWEETFLAGVDVSGIFAYPIFTAGGKDLNILWQYGNSQALADGRLAILSPDHTVKPPIILPRSFTIAKPTSMETATASVTLPEDSSGIAGFSWIWTQDPKEEPPQQILRLPTESEIIGSAPEDGTWYFKVRANDYAGNWSTSTALAFTRDMTPPLAPIISALDLDEAGTARSNDISLLWNPAEPDSLAGYTWSLEYISSIPSDMAESPLHPLVIPPEDVQARLSELLDTFYQENRKLQEPPRRLMGAEGIVDYTNPENGMYMFSVAAIDEAGNIGPAAVMPVMLNKFVPRTFITTLDNVSDPFGALDVSLFGGGFTYDGTISSIYIDRDGLAPFDLELSAADFIVLSNNRIEGLHLPDLERGWYYVGLMHTDRGLYVTPEPMLRVDFSGTIKFGNYEYRFSQSWNAISRKFGIQFGSILLWSVFILALLGLTLSSRALILARRDAIVLRKEIHALMTGDAMPSTKKQVAESLKLRGLGLKFKLVFFTIALVLMIILLVSIPLGRIMQRTQEQTLVSGLASRVEILLESLSSRVRAYLPSENILELGFLPDQIEALEEANYATILGLSQASRTTHLEYVWASNDPNIERKIDTDTLQYGTSRITNARIKSILDECDALNAKAVAQAGAMANEVAALNAEAISLVGRQDRESIARRAEIQQISGRLNDRLTTDLNALSKYGNGSSPAFSNDVLDYNTTTYLFYKPVLYRQGGEQQYVRGLVLVEISTDSLIQSVAAARAHILWLVGIIALVAISLGAVGAVVLASVITNPIRQLAVHVALIRDVDDKEELAGKELSITSRDEIGMLGETVNAMTHGLAKAAAAAKDLTVGKEVQKMFIPLETDSSGKKLTTGSFDSKDAQFFGYYEGAKGVSGDYFDYKQLDDRWYAVIKCDVSGKGVPAALIMVEVATLFLNYFKDWTYKTHGIKLSGIVTQINDLLEARGFKGRFAAFTLCLFDSVSGTVHFCNAGDNLIHIYDSAKSEMKTITLPETAAAGVFPSFMLDMKGGFKSSSLKLKTGDVLFLYTDGIEEAKRLFRDAEFNPIVCAEPGLAQDEPHGNHSVGQENEELTPDRVQAIIESVYAHSIYRLEKWHNPVENEILEFDFSTCGDTAADAILALVSVEKVFRMYRKPDASEADKVMVDRKIDSFLREHFRQYETYCFAHADVPHMSEYVYYNYLSEDEQYDDLTLVAIKKN